MSLTKVTNRMIEGSKVNVLDYGAVGDGVTDDAAAFQTALNSGKVVYVPIADYAIGSTLIINANSRGMEGEIFGDGSGSRLIYSGTGSCIKFYDASTRRVTQAKLTGLAIRVNTDGANAIDFTDAAYCTFRDLFIRLNNSNQAGIYGTGNGAGAAPYYNVFDGISIFGNADPATYPNQDGFVFKGDASGNSANGPNANLISNCRHIAGLNHGAKIESGVGNVFSNIVMESISEYSYRFGNALSPAVGRADSNRVTNHWQEGASTCVFARFEGYANDNNLTNYVSGSTNTVLFDNQSTGNDNHCKPKGDLYTVHFYGKDIPANTTTVLSPTDENWPITNFGVIVPFSGMIPYIMHVSVHNFASGGAGNGVVQAYRTGLPITDLVFTANNSNRFGGSAFQRTPNVADAFNVFDGTINSQIGVTITTDALWNQTSSDVQVSVSFFG